jgi:glucokinase
MFEGGQAQLAGDNYWIGLDVGGTKVEVLVVDRAMRIQGLFRRPMNVENAQTSLESICQAVEQALGLLGERASGLAAIGVGIPGQVERNEVKYAVNLNLVSCPVGAVLSERFGVPCALENDVRAAAVGASYYLGQRETFTNLAYLSIGTGISAGLVLEGRLYRGSHGMAGEIGHVVVDPHGPLCKCGQAGCLETIAAGPAIMLKAQQAVEAGQKTRLSEVSPLDTEMVYRMAAEHDPLAEEIVAEASNALASAVQWLVMGYDVDKVAIGGGVSHTGSNFLAPVLAGLARLRQGSALASDMLADHKILLMPSDFNAGVWGAVRLAQQCERGGGKPYKMIPSYSYQTIS